MEFKCSYLQIEYNYKLDHISEDFYQVRYEKKKSNDFSLAIPIHFYLKAWGGYSIIWIGNRGMENVIEMRPPCLYHHILPWNGSTGHSFVLVLYCLLQYHFLLMFHFSCSANWNFWIYPIYSHRKNEQHNKQPQTHDPKKLFVLFIYLFFCAFKCVIWIIKTLNLGFRTVCFIYLCVNF